ncbi:MAG: GNAT family N-acetyltransferase [Clostridiales bacterium]|nr:GNAT family N-acetyltransferase [Clostridiales bacterium]
MKFIQGKTKNEFIAQNENNEILGKGYIYESMASKIHKADRVNYFIEMKVDNNDEEIKRDITHHLIEVAKIWKAKNYPTIDGRVYHCCFGHDQASIDFYSTVDGFVRDEGMLILECSLDTTENVQEMNEYQLIEDNLNSIESTEEFIREHSRIFSSAYTHEKLSTMKNENRLKSFGIYHGNDIIANILVVNEEYEDKNQWWIDDLYVNTEYRKKGLADYLLSTAHNYLHNLKADNVKLEVWSANNKATSLYYKRGYKTYQESQVSIGMSI